MNTQNWPAQMATASREFIELVLLTLKKSGIDFDERISSGSFNMSALLKNQDWIEEDKFLYLWKIVEEKNQNKNLGLQLGQIAIDFPGHILFSIAHNCKNIGDAVKKFCAYHNIMNTIFNPVLDIHPHLASLSLRYSNPLKFEARQTSEGFISLFHILLNKLTENAIRFKEIHFTHNAPEDLSEHKRIFKTDIRFNQEQNALFFDKKYLKLPIFSANSALLATLEKYARQIQEQQISSPEWTGKVIKTLLKEMPGKRPNLGFVSKQLARSPRNLQLKLKEEGTSFRTLLTDILKKSAVEYLLNTDCSIFEISCLLGYADQSAFQRSFVQWKGISPRKYRIKKKR